MSAGVRTQVFSNYDTREVFKTFVFVDTHKSIYIYIFFFLLPFSDCLVFKKSPKAMDAS